MQSGHGSNAAVLVNLTLLLCDRCVIITLCSQRTISQPISIPRQISTKLAEECCLVTQSCNTTLCYQLKKIPGLPKLISSNPLGKDLIKLVLSLEVQMSCGDLEFLSCPSVNLDEAFILVLKL